MELCSLQLTILSITELKNRIKQERMCCHNDHEKDTHTSNSSSKRMIPLHSIDMEINRRKLCLLYYLLKAPLFNRYVYTHASDAMHHPFIFYLIQLLYLLFYRATMPLLKLLSSTIKQYIPMLSILVPDGIFNTLSYIHKYHFYHSNSS